MRLRLKEIRKAKRLTQRQVAEKAGISLSYYTEIENGTKQLNQRRLEQIAKALGVSPLECFVDEENGKRVYVMSLYDSLDEQTRALALQVLEQMAGAQRKP